MSRRELTAQLAKKTGVSVRLTTQLLRVLVDLVAAELAHVRRLEWRGFGTFTVRSYPARKIHVPATGKTIQLPPRAGITFKPSPQLLSHLPNRRPQRALPGAIDRSRRVRPAPVPAPAVRPATRRRILPR